MPEAVKLTTLKLLKEAGGADPGPRPYAAAAELLGYCVLGAQGFTECNGPSLAGSVETPCTTTETAFFPKCQRLRRESPRFCGLWAGQVGPETD